MARGQRGLGDAGSIGAPGHWQRPTLPPARRQAARSPPVALGIPLLAGTGAISAMVIPMHRSDAPDHGDLVLAVILAAIAVEVMAVEVMANGLRALFPVLAG